MSHNSTEPLGSNIWLYSFPHHLPKQSVQNWEAVVSLVVGLLKDFRAPNMVNAPTLSAM